MKIRDPRLRIFLLATLQAVLVTWFMASRQAVCLPANNELKFCPNLQ
ncbi:hypothetical protein HMPREF1557_00885 [Streptococcus sobrinus W1703]|uniref:Uncharacterized protein n=1 Tax=Streptococcus sobrinus W1703 TaxID=1227275 RepID=U2KP28_9STRE|nr:hypothetical protein HMPREF1557_00885 [Streptococcus sobrinus W1703]